MAPVTFADIQKAAERLSGKIVHTPLLEAPLLNAALGFRLLVKAECLQRTGSFKVRGAMNALLQLSPDAKAKGVVAFSSGNHAQGVAYAARELGVTAVIVMPKDAPALKIANTRAYGAEVVLYDREKESREAIGEDLSSRRGLSLIKPFDDVRVIAGQGTAGLEIAAQCKSMGVAPDHVIVPCSGGGLCSGIGLAVTETFPSAQIHTGEPNGFDDAMRSLQSGKKEANDKKAGSICDALMSDGLGDITLPLLRSIHATGFAVSDEEAMKAMAVAARYLKIVLEPGGAVGLAAAMFRLKPKGQTVVAVGSGGNADPAMLAKAIAQYSDAALN
ncbi:MAG TPA: threonine/serine dehydratase [Alphaproteobacteria bacterium]|nr:threonine/serine dehydratase [Alphaproteobacteria bacterium]